MCFPQHDIVIKKALQLMVLQRHGQSVFRRTRVDRRRELFRKRGGSYLRHVV